MDKFFDAKFYQDAMSSAFSCQLARAGNDTPKMSQRKLGAVRPFASNIIPDNQTKKCDQAIGNDDPEVLQVNHAASHCAAKSAYILKPLHGWTSDQQLSLIAASKKVQSARSLMNQHCGWTEDMAYHKYLQLISEKMQSKNARECEQCLNHMRVAYFGN